MSSPPSAPTRDASGSGGGPYFWPSSIDAFGQPRFWPAAHTAPAIKFSPDSYFGRSLLSPPSPRPRPYNYNLDYPTPAFRGGYSAIAGTNARAFFPAPVTSHYDILRPHILRDGIDPERYCPAGGYGDYNPELDEHLQANFGHMRMGYSPREAWELTDRVSTWGFGVLPPRSAGEDFPQPTVAQCLGPFTQSNPRFRQVSWQKQLREQDTNEASGSTSG